jgi:ABC-type branched-subunit amino acid transport system ATPase component
MSDVLEVSGLHAGYGAGDILKGIDLAVPEGGVVTIIGPNGSGKSTLIKTLAGLLPVRQGNIALRGSILNGLSAPQRVKAGLSYVPQEYNVFRNLTVLENLKIAREFMSPAKTAAGPAISDELIALFPELPGKFKVLAGNLSGGQRQMLAFACALTVRPALLMLDEPSAGLSPKYMADIFETVAKVNRMGVSVLMIEQNAIEALRISTRCVVMANGRVRMVAPADKVLDMQDLHSLYLGDSKEAA